MHVVGLGGVRTGIVSRHRDVDRVIQHERCVDEASVSVAVSAVAGMAAAALDLPAT